MIKMNLKFVFFNIKTMNINTFFPYYWYLDEEEKETTVIRVYGLDKNNKNVCVIVNNFTPYVYIELPEPYSQWNETNAQRVGDKLDELLGDCKPHKKSFMMKYRLYYAYINPITNKRIKFPYLWCSFNNKEDIKQLFYKSRKSINITGIGYIKIKIHESDASPILQMCCLRNISTAGWVRFSGNQISVEEQITSCDFEYKVQWKNLSPYESNDVALPLIMSYDLECNSSVSTAMPDAKKVQDKVFQISCTLSRPGMKEIQYKNYLLSLGDPDQEKVGKNVEILKFDTEAELLVGWTNFIQSKNPNVITGYNIFMFDIPYMLERAKQNLCIYEFDQQGFLKYGHAKEKNIKWSSAAYKDQFFQYLDAEGRLFVDLLPLVKRDYKFTNYKLKTVATNLIGQTKDDLSPQGIFKCYRIGMKGGKQGSKALGICGKYCMKDTILVANIFEKTQTWIGLTEMARVCRVPIFSLYTQGQQIKVYSQMYYDCTYKNYVVEKDGYTPKENEHYQGAIVFEPITGVHDNVVSFDFASLYPSTMIAYNLDYSTLVPDDSDIPDSMCGIYEWSDHLGCIHDPNIIKKNELSNKIKIIDDDIKLLIVKRDSCGRDKIRKFQLQEEINLKRIEKKPFIEKRGEYTKKKPKNKMCCKRRYKFIKPEYGLGIMPNVLKDLINARSITRIEQKKVKASYEKLEKEENMTENITKEIENLKILWMVLEKRQLAYKVSANSGYGATGVSKGYLPCMPVAMTTTALGRQNIEIVANVIPKKYKGEFVYGDTDSNYVKFPHIKKSYELWDYCLKVAKEISELFPKPNQLEFENNIYTRYLILTKKRYMSLACNRDGILETNKDGTKKINKKGVLLQRRDNCDFVRNLYSDVVMKIFDRVPRDDILYHIVQEIIRLLSGQINYKEFIITKAIGNNGGRNNRGQLQPSQPFKDEKGNERVMIGNYKVPALSLDSTKREQQFKLKNCRDVDTYYTRCLPAQMQLAEKMRKRGQIVDNGSRIEYVITIGSGINGKQFEKIEDVEYYSKYRDVIKLDYFYYLKSLVNPLDQILNCVYDKQDENKYIFKRNFVKNQFDYCLKFHKNNLETFKELTNPKLIFPDEKKNKIKTIKKLKVVNDDDFIIIEDSDIEEPENIKVKEKKQRKEKKDQKKKYEQALIMEYFLTENNK